jgi:hypothetical protein
MDSIAVLRSRPMLIIKMAAVTENLSIYVAIVGNKISQQIRW